MWFLLYWIPSVAHLNHPCVFMAQLELYSQEQPEKRTKSYKSEKTPYVYVSLLNC